MENSINFKIGDIKFIIWEWKDWELTNQISNEITYYTLHKLCMWFFMNMRAITNFYLLSKLSVCLCFFYFFILSKSVKLMLIKNLIKKLNGGETLLKFKTHCTLPNYI